MGQIRRVKSCIKGLDEAIEGGFPEGSVILLTGPAGSGKTILALHFAFLGAVLYDEPAFYITVEEPAENIKAAAAALDLDLSVAGDKFQILDFSDPDAPTFAKKGGWFDMDALLDVIREKRESMGVKRLVLDSVTAIIHRYKTTVSARRDFFRLVCNLKRWGITSLLLSCVREGSTELSQYGFEEYICDGVILLGYERIRGSYLRWLTVRKMRFTNHSKRVMPLEISRQGVVVYPEQEVIT